ncbi:MAG: SRPBCC family protein [Spirochaetia bacterium]|nr:SRPBCC family protein [Spirochaetia bacterium]
MFKKCALATFVFLAVVAICLSVCRQSLLHWGATPDEIISTMPGDELLPDSAMTSTRSIEIQTSSEKVWPWLVQIGQGRGGFYSYDWLESMFGLDIQNADKIVPELQKLKRGDLIPFSKSGGINVIEIKPEQLLVLAGTFFAPEGTKGYAARETMVGGTWVFMLEKTGEHKSRLVVRSRVAKFEPVWISKIFMRLLEPAHFIMERKMLMEIKKRAERR